MIAAFADQPALAEGVARFRGEAVALIAFEDGAACALDDFPVAWTPLPALADPAAAEAPDAPALHAHRPGNRLIEGRVRRGDAAAALGEAAHVAKDTFRTGFVEHAYIEPEAGAAWLDGDTLVIRACTQSPYLTATTPPPCSPCRPSASASSPPPSAAASAASSTCRCSRSSASPRSGPAGRRA